MQVTTEDGGRLNAFAKEPRMVVMDVETSRSRDRNSLMMLIGGSFVVAALIALTERMSFVRSTISSARVFLSHWLEPFEYPASTAA